MSNVITPAAAPALTHRVTLVEGEYYGHGLVAFHKNRPVEVTEALATQLAQQVTTYPISMPGQKSRNHSVAKFRVERIDNATPGGQIQARPRPRPAALPAAAENTVATPANTPPLQDESATAYLARLSAINSGDYVETAEERLQREGNAQDAANAAAGQTAPATAV